MKSKRLVSILSVIAALILLAGSCSAGFAAGWFFNRPSGQQAGLNIIPQSNNSAPAATTTTAEELFKPFWQAWDIVHEYFVD